MKWLKHMSDAREDPECAELLAEYGPAGYGIWWLILEEIGSDLRNSGPTQQFSLRQWAQKAWTTPDQFREVVEFMGSDEIGLVEFIHEGRYLTITVPNVEKYHDDYTRKSRVKIENPPDNPPTEPDTPPAPVRPTPANVGQVSDTPPIPVEHLSESTGTDEEQVSDFCSLVSSLSPPVPSTSNQGEVITSTSTREKKKGDPLPPPKRLPKQGGQYQYPDEFERVWEIHPQGTKANAYKAYYAIRSKETIDPPLLVRSLQTYLADCRQQDRSTQDLSTFFGPIKETWRDYLHGAPERASPAPLPFSRTTAQNIETAKNWRPPKNARL